MATEEGLFIVGDSHGEEYRSGWPWHLEGNPTQINLSTGGDGLVNDIEPTYVTDAAAVDVSRYPIAIIQGGVNDIANDGYGASDCQTAITSMVATANGLGFDTYVMGMSPWAGAAGWDAAKQTETDSFNTWLAANEVALGFTFIDIYSDLEDGVAADELLAAYDSDGTHLNQLGYTAWGAIVIATLPALTRISAVANKYSLWRGAVQPASTGASGNEYRVWRGAVTPAGGISGGLSRRPGFIDADGLRNRRQTRYATDESNDVSYRLGQNDAPAAGTYDNKRRNRYS